MEKAMPLWLRNQDNLILLFIIGVALCKLLYISGTSRGKWSHVFAMGIIIMLGGPILMTLFSIAMTKQDELASLLVPLAALLYLLMGATYCSKALNMRTSKSDDQK